jgi:hypothetical protein
MNLVEETLSAPHPANGYRIQRVLYHLRHYYTRPIYRDRCDYSAASRPYRRCRPARQGNRRRSGRASKIAHPSFQLPRHCRPCRHDEPFQHARCRGIEPSALSAVRMFSHPIWNLFKFYVLRGGFFDGGSGLYAAMTAAFYVFLKYSESLRAPSRSAPRGKTAPLLWFATTRLGCRKPPMRRSPLFGIAKIVGLIEPITLFANSQVARQKNGPVPAVQFAKRAGRHCSHRYSDVVVLPLRRRTRPSWLYGALRME